MTRLIAFYLPQYHPIPENDEWWGKGFTEWTNVAKAKPLFKGHYQPHLPADLGFYDLRVPEVRQAQADMARDYGIYGFCYYHYWFNGKQLLERPFQEVLESGQPDFPFCVCWANENWTRRWDGQDQEILALQEYSTNDDIKHITHLVEYFKDPRYIKIHEKPLILIYRISNLPNPKSTADIWRRIAKQAGFPDIYLCTVLSSSPSHINPTDIGFDSAVDFVPDWKYLPPPIRPPGFKIKLIRRIMKRLSHNPKVKNRVNTYKDLRKFMLSRPENGYKVFPCVTPGWDNSARRKSNAIIFAGSNPELYREWLQILITRSTSMFNDIEEQLVFINAWNEWGEGNHLEPDSEWGRKYLEATLSALESVITPENKS